MTREQLKIIHDLGDRVRQTMYLCDRLKEENTKLRLHVAEQESSCNKLREERTQLQLKYDNLKAARIIAANRNDFRATKNRLSGLVQEVDECIALFKK